MTTDGITFVHLPSGPTAYFKLTSIQLTKEIHVISFLSFSSSARVLSGG